jgi:hypothetical protein
MYLQEADEPAMLSNKQKNTHHNASQAITDS